MLFLEIPGGNAPRSIGSIQVDRAGRLELHLAILVVCTVAEATAQHVARVVGDQDIRIAIVIEVAAGDAARPVRSVESDRYGGLERAAGSAQENAGVVCAVVRHGEIEFA